MKGIMQVFISITPGGILVHTLGIAHDQNGQHPDWIREAEGKMGLAHLDPFTRSLERRGFTKQPSTGYLLIYALVVDEAALPQGK